MVEALANYKELPLNVQAHLDTLACFIIEAEEKGEFIEDAVSAFNCLVEYMRQNLS